jgi:hypothetical protein
MLILHIVGINTFIKQDMVNKFKELKFEIFDLDDISKDIVLKYKRENIGSYWKKKLTDNLNNFIKSTNNNIIILGLSSFVLDRRFKINIPTNNKFFYSIPYDLCASQLITYNLDYYRTDIIDGKFPIKYINHDFLMMQRKELQEEYTDLEYKLKTPDMLNNWFETNLDIVNNKNNKNNKENEENEDNCNDKVYMAFIKRFENEIPKSYLGSSPVIIGYKDKWMALASILPKTSVKRGLLKGKHNKTEPYLKELHVNGFSNLKKPCYVYEFNSKQQLDPYRYEIKEPVFSNRYYVSNMYDELSREGVFLDRFKF